jgi:lycopene cyclase domain-containing protein
MRTLHDDQVAAPRRCRTPPDEGVTTMLTTYLDFHLWFVAPPFFALLFVAGGRLQERRRLEWAGVGIVLLIALAYTIPWDNYLIARGVWDYAPGSVSMTVWLAPIEEYLFIALQSIVAGLWLYSLPPLEGTVSVSWRDRSLGVLAGVLVGATGALLLVSEPTFYLGAILAWAGPVLALQWVFGWPYLAAQPRRVAIGVAVPTVYFAVADRVAIATGIWRLSPEFVTGISVVGLPIEEGAFFLLTNLFVVQGLLLYSWVLRR